MLCILCAIKERSVKLLRDPTTLWWLQERSIQEKKLIYGPRGHELTVMRNMVRINLSSKVSPTGPPLLIFLHLPAFNGWGGTSISSRFLGLLHVCCMGTRCWKSWIVSSLDKDVPGSSCLSLSVSINKWINYRAIPSPETQAKGRTTSNAPNLRKMQL